MIADDQSRMPNTADTFDANAEPQMSWLGFVVTGKARASIRRAVRAKEYAEVAEIGRKLFEELAERLPAKIGRKAIAAAVGVSPATVSRILRRLGLQSR